MQPVVDEKKLAEYLRSAIFEILDGPVGEFRFSVIVGGQRLNMVLLIESADLICYTEEAPKCPVLLPS